MTDQSVIKIMPRKKQDIEALKDQRRQLILEKALELFAQNGYHKTTMEEIARACGISKGLVYNYFPGKKNLLLTLLELSLSQIETILPQKAPQQITREDIENFITSAFETVNIQSKDSLKLYYMLMAQADIQEIIRPIIHNFLDKIVQLLTPFFKNMGVENTRAYILSFLSALDGIGMYYTFLDIQQVNEMIKITTKKFLAL